MSEHYAPVLVTGASRGIGAATVIELASRGHDVGIGVRDKLRRANKVLSSVEKLGNVRAEVFQGDLTNPEDLNSVINKVKVWAPKLGGLILNAAGGLEEGKTEEYALAINRDAQVNLTKGLTDSMLHSSTVVYVTSDWSHLYEQIDLPPFDYKAVASSKRLGEDALVDLIPELTERDIRLVVVTGGLITGTFVGDYAVNNFPEFTEEQRTIHNVVSVEKFSEAIADVINNDALPTGHIESVGAPLVALFK